MPINARNARASAQISRFRPRLPEGTIWRSLRQHPAAGQTSGMESMSEQAARWGIEPDYLDAFGRRQSSDPDAVARLVDILSKDPAPSTTKPPAGAERSEARNLPPVPERAFQGGEQHPRRIWALAVQL